MENAHKKKFQLASWRTIEILIAVVLITAVLGLGYWWFVVRTQVYTDKAEIYAPLIELSPSHPEVLKQLLVHEGDAVVANQSVARLGDTYLTTATKGIIVGVNNAPGTLFSPGISVVTMINPNDLRVVARIDENAGFTTIRSGDAVTFTVDAYGRKEYHGIVDEIAKTSHQSSVVFSISDKREVKQFEIKIKFDPKQYPELLNGMSARVWIHI